MVSNNNSNYVLSCRDVHESGSSMGFPLEWKVDVNKEDNGMGTQQRGRGNG